MPTRESQLRRLRDYLQRELPRARFSEEVLSYLLDTLEGDEPLPQDKLADVWTPYLLSSGACDSEEEARIACRRVLKLDQNTAAVSSTAPRGTSAAAAADKGRATAGYPASGDASSDGSQELSKQLASEINDWLQISMLGQYAQRAHDWARRNNVKNFPSVLRRCQELSEAIGLKRMEMKRLAKEVESRAFGPEDDLKRYFLLKEIGSGATAKVYKCAREDDLYAVKVVDLGKVKRFKDASRRSDNLRREVSILFNLRHPKVVSLYEVFVREGESLYLVMELVQGCELRDLIISEGTFLEPKARSVFLQVVEGLLHVHSKDIVHRDLKPENILVDETASRGDYVAIKLSDFGHSKILNDGYSEAKTHCGTPEYWAPEVVNPPPNGYDSRVDLWSLGVVLYVMLFGSYPLGELRSDGQTSTGVPIAERVERMRNFLQDPALPDNAINKMRRKVEREGAKSNPGLSAGARQVILGLVKLKPAERLSLEQCRSHPWTEHGKDEATRSLSLASVSSNEEDVHIALPSQPSKEDARRLRSALIQWQIKYSFPASLKHQEIVVNFEKEGGDGAEDKRAAAESDMRALIDEHFSLVVAA
eukprot:TRINITY_DN12752_c0_g1_i1.p1 TRINITY_DN12752_c0_g1~~TRINITY_DN12752_c0_g1_i1.p1  ORF type:complete len:592 (-),score=122.43 TRINITY_DN12752_c0_g1_i1:114-1889(-)